MPTRVCRFVSFGWMALLAIVAGCGGSGGGGGDSAAPALQTGSMMIAVSGLPAGIDAAITVTGGGSAQAITGSRTLANLTPGNYTVAAVGVTSGGTVYSPQSASQMVAVNAGATASVTVAYSATRLALQEVASGLASPLLLTAPANDSRKFIVERAGTIRILQGGALLATPFLDISARIRIAGEGGLLSMAFHPNYASNGLFFVYFTDLNGDIAVERFHVSADPDVADTTPLRIVSIAHPININHYGGLLAFGSDGFLYVGVGDGGGAGDTLGNAQNLNTLLGKLLRLDVASASAAQPYVVPSGNPFVGQANRRGEIWAYGLRNPWRYAFDTASAMLYIADVGQDRREEIDVASSAAAGLNYGWNTTEGMLCYPVGPCSIQGLTLPVLDYGHDAAGGCSITGGYVYRGSAIAELQGRYFYSDFCSGWLRSFALVNGAATEKVDWNIANVGQILSFGADAQNELYMLSTSGKIYKIVRG